jgi:hypothetical protein
MTDKKKVSIKKEVVLSFIAGLFGGFLGYLIGAWADSQWTSVILFFVFGFLGYRAKDIPSTARDVLTELFQLFALGFSKAWKLFRTGFPNPVIGSIIGVYLGMVVWASALENSGFHFNPSSWPELWAANTQWLETGNNIFNDRIYNQSASARGVSFFMSKLLAIVVGLVAGWAGSWTGRATRAVSSEVRNFIQLTTWADVKFAWKLTWGSLFTVVFYLTLGWVLVLLKGIVLTLIGIHSIRRLAAGLSTAIGGMVYMIFVPFTITGIPIALAAIGCALTCGGTAALVALALDGDKVGNFLDRQLDRKLPHFVPSRS